MKSGNAYRDKIGRLHVFLLSSSPRVFEGAMVARIDAVVHIINADNIAVTKLLA